MSEEQPPGDSVPTVAGFVSLKSVKHGAPDPAAALAEIRQIYFKTTRKTIENDLAHAIDLVKSLPSEAEREKATVYMEGLVQMRREWAGTERREGARARPAGAKRPAIIEGAKTTERAGSRDGTNRRRGTDNKPK